jgi:caffeoyl-CoA O-methyltransferase
MTAIRANNVLEVGGFCGISALSMAEVLPDNGQITSLELDPFLVEFGKESRLKSTAGHKMKSIVGPAMASLKMLADEKENGLAYDFVVIDADRDNMVDYFQFVWDAPGFLSQGATVCIDGQPYKGQTPVRYVKHGKAPAADQWILPTGQDKVNELQKLLETSARFSFYKIGGLFVVKETGMSNLAI